MNTSFNNVMDHVGIYYKFNSSLKLLFLYLQLEKHTNNKREKKMMNSNIKKKNNHDYIVDYYMTKKINT